MLLTVYFYDKSRTRNIEIYDKVTNRFLPIDGHGESFEKVVPNATLFRCHILSERLS